MSELQGAEERKMVCGDGDPLGWTQVYWPPLSSGGTMQVSGEVLPTDIRRWVVDWVWRERGGGEESERGKWRREAADREIVDAEVVTQTAARLHVQAQDLLEERAARSQQVLGGVDGKNEMSDERERDGEKGSRRRRGMGAHQDRDHAAFCLGGNLLEEEQACGEGEVEVRVAVGWMWKGVRWWRQKDRGWL